MRFNIYLLFLLEDFTLKEHVCVFLYRSIKFSFQFVCVILWKNIMLHYGDPLVCE